MRCDACEGEGLVPVALIVDDSPPRPVLLPCPDCRGSGKAERKPHVPMVGLSDEVGLVFG
jgi:excinuclease UvrABC ATPase subunit